MNNNTELTVEQETMVFELVQRKAKLLASSSLVPKEFQGNMANCAIGLNIAHRLGADPFCVLQNIDIIHGRPSFRATFLIAMVNASGRFTPLQFVMGGEGKARSCVATAKTSSGETVEGPQITMVSCSTVSSVLLFIVRFLVEFLRLRFESMVAGRNLK